MCPSSAVCVSAPPAACPEPSRGALTVSSIPVAQEQHPQAPQQHPRALRVTSTHPSIPSHASAPARALHAHSCPILTSVLQHLPTASNTSPNSPAPPKCSKCPHAPNVPAVSLMLQHFSKSSSIHPVVQEFTPSTPTSLQCSSIPPNTPARPQQMLQCLCKRSSICPNIPASSPQKVQHPPKYSKISPDTPASPQTLQHPPKGSNIPSRPSPDATTPCPTHCPTLGSAPRCFWRCHDSIGAGRIDKKDLWELGHGHGRTL